MPKRYDPTWPKLRKTRGTNYALGRTKCTPTKFHALEYRRWNQNDYASISMDDARWSHGILFDIGNRIERRREVREAYTFLYDGFLERRQRDRPTHFFRLTMRNANSSTGRERIFAVGANLAKRNYQSDQVAHLCFEMLVRMIGEFVHGPADQLLLAKMHGHPLQDSSDSYDMDGWDQFLNQENDGKIQHFWMLALTYRWMHLGRD